MARRINRRSGGAQRCFASFVESEGPIPCAPRLSLVLSSSVRQA